MPITPARATPPARAVTPRPTEPTDIRSAHCAMGTRPAPEAKTGRKALRRQVLAGVWLVSALLGAQILTAHADEPQPVGSPTAGAQVFARCHACHSVAPDGRSGVGPNLHGVVGRPAASLEGFRYSPAMRAKGAAGLTWDAATLDTYLKQPRLLVPGTAMTFVGLAREEDRRDIIAFLAQQSAPSAKN